MKKLYITLAALFVVASGFAQMENPVIWSYSAKKVSDKVFDIYVTATIAPKWHVYAQDAGEGPEPTTFAFAKNPLVTMDGKVKELGTLEKEYDKNFNSVLKFYSNKVNFVQRVKLKSIATTVVKGTVTFMVCNDRKCLPPKEISFSVKVNEK
jgi:thiol:disulfide interchange protein DsbD